MQKTWSVQNCFFVLTLVGVLVAWRRDHLRLDSQVQTLENKLAIGNIDWQTRRQAIEKLGNEFDVNVDPTNLPHVLYALSDHDPIVRAHALDILEKLRLGKRRTKEDPEFKNPQPEFSFWAAVINSARKNSDEWDAIRIQINRLNQGESDFQNPFD